MFGRFAALTFIAGLACAAPRVDNVLEKMTPPDATSLVGAHMDGLKATDLYKKLIAAQKLPQIDQFAQDTGFDPRRDVRELLFVTTPKGRVLLARGTFRLNAAALKDVRKTRHGMYEIFGQEGGGFCILDSSLAAAGDIDAIGEALDEWTSGTHTGAQKLLAQVGTVNERAQIWGISTGAANFLADNVPLTAGGIDFSKIFRGLDGVWFEADLSGGLLAEVHGNTAAEKDAISLRDAVKGLVGLGRLSVPEKNPELLRLWDGIVAEQSGRSITIRADIAQDLIEKLVQMFSAAPGTSKRTSQRIL
jgi:hypothetical protein